MLSTHQSEKLVWVINSNDMEADDLIKELLILGIQKQFNLPANSDVIGQLAFYLSAGKNYMPFDEKKRRMQELVTSTQIFRGSQSFDEKFAITHFERVKGLLSETNVLISTAAPIEFFEFWIREPNIFANKTIFFYGAVNTNEWLLGYIQKHHSDLLKEFDAHSLVAQTGSQVLASATRDAAKPGAKPVNIAAAVQKAVDKAKAQLVMQKFFNAFQKSYCVENFPLWGNDGIKYSSITMEFYPITASHTKALFTPDANEVGRNMGLQVRDEATGVAKKQGEKIAGFIQYATAGNLLWDKFLGVFNKHGVKVGFQSPKDVLTNFELFSDQLDLICDLKAAFNEFGTDNNIERVERTYGGGKEGVSVDIYRAISIWSRTAPYDYQILNADGMIAILLYELMRDSESTLLMPMLKQQTLTSFDGSYTKFVPDQNSSFYYPETLKKQEEMQRLALYFDLVMGQLLYAANKTLVHNAKWRNVFAATGLDKVDPTQFSLVLLKDHALQQQLREVFVKQNIELATQFKQCLDREEKVSEKTAGFASSSFGVFTSPSTTTTSIATTLSTSIGITPAS